MMKRSLTTDASLTGQVIPVKPDNDKSGKPEGERLPLALCTIALS